MFYYMIQDWMWVSYELNDWEDKFTEETWDIYNYYFEKENR